MAPVCIVGFGLPLTLMGFVTAPFVAKIYLVLPVWARKSSAQLHRYAASLPASAELEIASIKWAIPRHERAKAGELYIQKGPVLGAMTLRRDVPSSAREHLKWYQRGPVKRYAVAGKTGPNVPERGLWEGVLGAVTRGWGPINKARPASTK